jgi:hypothetical protein
LTSVRRACSLPYKPRGPYLSEGARIRATGGGSADRPWSSAASLGVQKAALRDLVAALDSQLESDDIRGMSLTVAGTVQAGTPFAPHRIADAFLAATTTAEVESCRDSIQRVDHS